MDIHRTRADAAADSDAASNAAPTVNAWTTITYVMPTFSLSLPLLSLWLLPLSHRISFSTAASAPCGAHACPCTYFRLRIPTRLSHPHTHTRAPPGSSVTSPRAALSAVPTPTPSSFHRSHQTPLSCFKLSIPLFSLPPSARANQPPPSARRSGQVPRLRPQRPVPPRVRRAQGPDARLRGHAHHGEQGKQRPRRIRAGEPRPIPSLSFPSVYRSPFLVSALCGLDMHVARAYAL